MTNASITLHNLSIHNNLFFRQSKSNFLKSTLNRKENTLCRRRIGGFDVWLFLTGCRNPVEPILNAPYETTAPVGESIIIPIEEIIVDSTLPINELSIRAESNSPDVTVDTSKTEITISASQDADATITFTAVDKCETEATLRFDVTFGAGTVDEGEWQDIYLHSSGTGQYVSYGG